jgi:tetratricopeptide (TPR) repeat protein
MGSSDDPKAPSPHAPGDRLQALLAMLEREPGDAFCLYGIAQEHARAGRHPQALEWFDRAIAADPDGAYAYFHKARSLEELDRVPEAVATLRTGLEAARRARDGHAASELAGYLDQLT